MSMRIIVAPGAFKNSLRADEVARAIESGIARSGLDAEVMIAPIADGGNGTLDAFLASGGQRKTLTVEDPVGRPVEAAYGLLPDGQTAVIEMALASGLELLKGWQLNPMIASTYGTGQLMKAALDDGVKRIIIGMGGSATVDGGAGCLQALGVHLFDAYGRDVPRGGGNLDQIFVIDWQGLDPRWKNVEVLIASDVDNPPLGEKGAAAVFGPQKGATPQQVEKLEANLRHFFTLVRDQLGVDVLNVEGGGAAGAFAAGLMAFLNGRIVSGIDLILQYSGFTEALQEADLVITGEGQMDAQTIHGKGPIGVARLAQQHGVPTIAIVGGLNVRDDVLHDAGLQAVLPIVTGPMSLDEAIEHAAELVERAALRLGYILQVAL
ncbi:MAG TPA: glycerate kinase [Spirillospora sp.]|nr:glycerate kinase [Spirillospora sp.]